MRQFTEDTLTDAVIARLKECKDPRFARIMESAVRHLHAFAKEVELTEEEWFEGIKFLTAVGQKCDTKRQEFILLSDILGLSMMVVALNHKTAPGATEATVIGPFFTHGARELEYGADLRVGATVKGEDCWVGGRVLSVDGKPIPGAVTHRPGFEQPVYYWDPVIAPSGAQFYTGDAFPEWRGSLFTGGLKDRKLVRLSIEDGKVVGEEHLLEERGKRVRDVREGRDGALYLVTDESDGELWKLAPRR